MLRDFFRTLRSYTLFEAVASLLLIVIFFWSFSQILGGGSSADDTYTEGAVGKILVLNPLYANFNEVDRDITQLIFSGLMRYDSRQGAMVDDLAKVTMSEDQMLYTFVIKPGVTFHTGKTLTADDVYFTYHDIIQSEEFSNSVLRANFSGVAITKKDAKTVQFQLDQPNSFFITNLSVGILSRDYYGDIPVGDLLLDEINKKPVGSGPYRVNDEYVASSRGEGKLSLIRYDDFYGGLPVLKHLVFRTYSSVDRLISSSSEFDAVGKISGDGAKRLADEGFAIHPYQLPQFKAAFFNTSRPFIKERSVRLALLKSVQKDELLKQLPDTTPVDTPFMELAQDQWVNKPDVKEAQGALFDAGYRYPDPKNPGIRAKKGVPLRLTLVYFEKSDAGKTVSEDSLTAQFLKNSWDAIGIGLDIKVYPPDQRSEMVSKRDYDILLAGESLGYDLDTYFFWHSTQATELGSNLSNYRNFSADALIEDIRRYFDEARKSKRLTQLAGIVQGDIPALFLYRPVYYYASQGRFDGYALDKLAFPADRFFNIQLWKPVK